MKKILLPFFILTVLPTLLMAQTPADSPKYQKARGKMVLLQIQMRGVSDKKVLNAMNQVPRHSFVPEELISRAYADHPLPVGQGQTISQPYIVALEKTIPKCKQYTPVNGLHKRKDPPRRRLFWLG
jgi:protein-L-isoaspartate(D-aspartate) O-methyltransferase